MRSGCRGITGYFHFQVSTVSAIGTMAMQSTGQGGRQSSQPVHCGAMMVCIDWLMFAANLLFSARELLSITLFGVALCAALVLWIEHLRDGATWKLAGQKAVAAGLAVAVPLPIVGSMVGAIGLVWALIAGPPQRKRPGH